MVLFNKFLLVILFALITSNLIGCDSKKSSKEKYLEKGKVFLEHRNYEKARIEFKNVLQIDPKDADSYYYLGEIYLKKQEWSSAYSYYLKAIELNPAHLDAHARIGQFLLSQSTRYKDNNKKEAIVRIRNKIEMILNNDPAHVEGLLLQASLETQLQNYDKAISQLDEIIVNNPTNVKSVLLLAKIYEKLGREGDVLNILNNGLKRNTQNIELYFQIVNSFTRQRKPELAIQTLKRLIEKYPDSLEYHIKLASYYSIEKRDKEAERVYLDAILARPEDARRYIALAEFTGMKKGLSGAIEVLQSAIIKLPNEPALHFSLAVLYNKSGGTEKSISILKQLINKFGNDRLGIIARKELAKIYAIQGKTDNVTEVIKEIFEVNPNDGDALLINGQNEIILGNYEAAIPNFNSILKLQPDSVQVLLLLAEAYQQQGHTALSRKTLKKVLKISPSNPEANIALARYYLAERKDNEASEHIKIVLKKQPDNLPALILASEMLAINSNLKALIPVLNKIKQVAPDSPEGWFRTGRMYLALNDYTLARDEILIAWEKSPDSVDLLAELIDIEIILKDFDTSRQRLNKILREEPEHKTAHKFLGMIALAANEPSVAEKEFILQIKKVPDDIVSHIELAKLYNFKHDYNNAAKIYKQALMYSPNDLHSKFGLANTLEMLHRYDEAITLYDEILMEKPNDVIVINNLAMLLVNHKTDKDSFIRAERLAEKFIGNNAPMYLDTLGWVYYKIGKYDKALPVLEEAVRQAPKVALYQYHLALVHLNIGNEAMAKKLLKNAVQAKRFTGKENAEEILKELMI